MEEIMEIMAAQIVPAVVVVFATLISVGMVHLNKWLKLKTGSEAIVAAGEVVAATVNELTATAVTALKAASKDGKLTLREGEAIKNEAVTRIKTQMPPAIAKAACMAIGDLDVYLKGKIEQEVSKSKISKV